jgi:hypothetical protein
MARYAALEVPAGTGRRVLKTAYLCRPTSRRMCSVILAEGVHPIPFRTRQLSPPAPMVLRRQAVGE